MMDGYQKTGFQKFRETKAAIPAGMAAALLITSLLVAMGFVDMLGGLCIAILSFFVLRMFGIRKLEFLLIFAVLMFVVFAAEIYLISSKLQDDLSTGVTNIGNYLYSVFMLLVFPYLILTVLVWWMRRSLERTRARLEAEGRLYPQGYGRCKRCGTIVLPGEISCRKCGEYIDVPEELRVKKVNYFECSECGREVPEDAGVCPYCGEVFEDDTDGGKEEGI